MTLRPTGMQSETHRKLARAVGQKHSRVARLRIAPDSIIAQEQQELLASQKKTRRPRASGASGLERRKRRSYGRRSGSVWSDDEPEANTFAETDEDDDVGYNGAPRKSRRLSGEGDGHMDGKRGAGDYQTDDFLVADSDEEEEDAYGGKHKDKKRSRRSDDKEDDEPDALDELDAKIARQDEENRRRKRAAERTEAAEPEGRVLQDEGETKESSDIDMEVESEEEEVFVRRTGTGSRKKRAIAVEEEDE